MRILYILFLIFVTFSGYVYFLYKTEKIIFLTSGDENFFKNSINRNQQYDEKRIINGIYMRDWNEQRTIPIYLSDNLFQSKNPEIFFYDAFFQFFRYINIYEVENFVLSLNHVAINNKKIIINMHIDKKKELSVAQEVNLVRSMYFTAKSILPYIENIYFYDDAEQFNFTHLLPYINKEIIEFVCKDDCTKKEFFSEQSILIPLIDKSYGNVINDIFEKNIFQSAAFPGLIFIKYPLYSEEWFKEIYTLNTNQNSQFFIYFGNFSKSSEPAIKIFIYPFLSDTDTVSLLNEIDRKIVFNQEIFSEVERIKKITTAKNIPLIVQIMPLKSILYNPANSIYFEISGRDRYTIQTMFNAIMEK